MVKKNNPKEKPTKDFTINFNDAIKHHSMTLKSARKWFENNIKINNQNNNLEDKIKFSVNDQNLLIISIDKTINFPKRKIIEFTKKLLKEKKAKYYSVRSISSNDFSVVAVK